MTHEEEEALRQRALGSIDAAMVLADYYEQSGQPTRAQMWRRAIEHPCSLGIPDLCVEQSPTTTQDPRRNMMIWILHHMVSRRTLAKLFVVSLTRVVQIIDDSERVVIANARREARAPTMAATVRLIAVGAVDSHFEMGDPPPDDWPRTKRKRQ